MAVFCRSFSFSAQLAPTRPLFQHCQRKHLQVQGSGLSSAGKQRSSPPSEFLYSQPGSQPSLTRRANDSFDDSEMIRLHCMICAGGEEITAPAAAHPSRDARPRSATASQQVATLSQCACSLTKITSSCLSFVLPSFMSSVLEAMHSLNAL